MSRLKSPVGLSRSVFMCVFRRVAKQLLQMCAIAATALGSVLASRVVAIPFDLIASEADVGEDSESLDM